MQRPLRFKDVLVITRAWSLNMTFVSVTLGNVLAFLDGGFSLGLYFLCLLAALLFHAGANSLNDYFDLKNKVDTPAAPTALYRPHSVFTGLLSPNELFLLSCFLIAGSLGIGALLAFFRYPGLGLIILAGLFLGVFYTARPFNFKYIALGEAVVFLVFGPLMVEGAYAVQRARLDMRAFLISLPFGMLVALVLFANNLRDREFDAKQGIKTLGVLLGPRRGARLFAALSLSAFALVIVYMASGILAGAAFLTFLALPGNINLVRGFSKDIPLDADAKTSRVTFFFGALLVLGLLLENLRPAQHDKR